MRIRSFKFALDGPGPTRVSDPAAFAWVDGDDALVAPIVLPESEIAQVGPTLYQIGATGLTGMRVDGPATPVLEEHEINPDGTIAITIGLPEGPIGYADMTQPGIQIYHIEGDTRFLSGDVGGASFGDELTLAPGWHTIVLAWEASSFTRNLYVDGSFFSSGSFGEFPIYPQSLRFAGPWDETLVAYTEPTITLVEFSIHDDIWDATAAMGYHGDMLAALDGEEPLAVGPPVEVSMTLHWDSPWEPVDGWLLRLALNTGELVQFKLPAEATSFDIGSELGVASGIAHLHAVNSRGQSVPAEVTF